MSIPDIADIHPHPRTERELVQRLDVQEPMLLAVQTGVTIKDFLRAYIKANCGSVERVMWEHVYQERFLRGRV